MTMGKIDISCDNCKFEKRCLEENSSATRYATGFICYEKESREMFNLIAMSAARTSAKDKSSDD